MKNEKSPRDRYDDARLMETPQGVHSKGALVEMQAAMLDALRSGNPLPDEMRLNLCFAFEYLCEGIASELLTPVKRPGGREPPILKKTQEDAIRYLRWCADGRIIDPSPSSTVGTAYDVSTRTVRNWLKSWGEKPTPPLKPMEDYGDVNQAAEADRVGRLMKINGKQYRRFKPKAKSKT